MLFDLTFLDSISRALSFIVVGLLALAGAYAYQRVSRHLEREPSGAGGPATPERPASTPSRRGEEPA